VAGRVEHVVDRHDDAQIERLRRARGDDLDRRGAAEEPRDLVDRPHRRRQPDALRRAIEIVARRRASSRSRLTARCAPRLVAATACTSSTMTVWTSRRSRPPAT
jgi:hypothetical protein